MTTTPTHAAVVTVAPRAALEVIQLPTISPAKGEVRVRVAWTASTPLDLHQADGGLLVQHPQVLGDGVAGTVVEVGDGVEKLTVGDKVSPVGISFVVFEALSGQRRMHASRCTPLPCLSVFS